MRLKETPSLKNSLNDEHWKAAVWSDAIAKAAEETGLDIFPEVCPWTFEQILDQNFFPEDLAA